VSGICGDNVYCPANLCLYKGYALKKFDESKWKEFTTEATRASKEGVTLPTTLEELEKYVTNSGEYYINFSKSTEEIAGKNYGNDRNRKRTAIPLSVNPGMKDSSVEPGTAHPTPLGIYAYPLIPLIYDDLKNGKIPFASGRDIINVFKIKPSAYVVSNGNDDVKVEDIFWHITGNKEYEKYFAEHQRGREPGDWQDFYDSVIKKYKGKDSEAKIIWRMFYRLIGGAPTDDISSASNYRNKKAHNFVRNWTHFLRAAGVDGFIDVTGEGYIHPNENNQTVIFGRQNIKVVDVLVNKAKPYQVSSTTQVFKKLRYFYINWSRDYHKKQTGENLPKEVAEMFLRNMGDRWDWFGKEVNKVEIPIRDKVKAFRDSVPATLQAGEHKMAPGALFVRALTSYWYGHVVTLSRIYDDDNTPANMEPVFAYYRTDLKVMWESNNIARKFGATDSLEDILNSRPETPGLESEHTEAQNQAAMWLDEYYVRWMKFKEIFRKASGGNEIEDVALDFETKGQLGESFAESANPPFLQEAAKTDISNAALYMDGTMVILYDKYQARPWLRRHDEAKVRPALLGVMDLGWSSQNKAYTVDQSWAKKGYGPVMYRLAMQAAHDDQPHVGLMPTPIRNQVSPEAENIWKNFYDGLGSASVTHKRSEQSRGKSPNHDKEHLDRIYFSKEPIVGLEQAIANNDEIFTKQADPYGEQKMTLVEAAAFHIRDEMGKIYNKIDESGIRADPNVRYEIDRTLKYRIKKLKPGYAVEAIYQNKVLAEFQFNKSNTPFKTIRGPLGPKPGDDPKSIGYYVITKHDIDRNNPNIKMITADSRAVEEMYRRIAETAYKLNSNKPVYLALKNNVTNKVWDSFLQNKTEPSGKIGYYKA